MCVENLSRQRERHTERGGGGGGGGLDKSHRVCRKSLTTERDTRGGGLGKISPCGKSLTTEGYREGGGGGGFGETLTVCV